MSAELLLPCRYVGEHARAASRRTRWYWSPPLLVLIVISVAGCLKTTSGSNTCGLGEPAVPTKINIISYDSPGMPFFGDQMARCSYGRLQIRHQMLPFDALVNQATISMSSPARSPYHIVHVYDQLLVEWAGKRWLAPLDDLIAKYSVKYHLNEIPMSVWDTMKVNGHFYGIPAIQNPEIFVYRKDLFAKYGLTAPRNIADLSKLCEVLQSKETSRYPLVMMYSKMSDHIAYEFNDMQHSLGGRLFGEDGSPRFNDTVSVDALQMMVSLFKKCVHPNAVNFTVEDALVGLQQGQFLMGVLWMNNTPQLDDPTASKYAGKFGFLPAPAACEGCAPVGYWAQDSWVIPANAGVDRELLFQVAMEGTNAENQAQASGMTLVTRPGVAGIERSPYWQAGVASIERGAVGFERRPYAYLAKDAIVRYGIEALQGHLSPRDALDRAAADYWRAMHEEDFVK